MKPHPPDPSPESSQRERSELGAERPGVREFIWRAVGGVLFVIGAIGLVLPVWPTTIFWILAALAFARSWPRMRDRIYAWPHIGSTIQDFNEHGRLSRTGKRHAVLGMLLGLAVAIAVKPSFAVAGVAGVLVATGIAYVLTRPERSASSSATSD